MADVAGKRHGALIDITVDEDYVALPPDSDIPARNHGEIVGVFHSAHSATIRAICRRFG